VAVGVGVESAGVYCEYWHEAPVLAAPVGMTGSAQLTTLGRHFVCAIRLVDSAASLRRSCNAGAQVAIQIGLILTGHSDPQMWIGMGQPR